MKTKLLALLMALMLTMTMTSFAIGEDTTIAPAETEAVTEGVTGSEDALDAGAAPEEPVDENPVLFTFGEKEFRKDAVQEKLDMLVSNGYANEGDYAAAIEYMVQLEILADKVRQLGFDQFTEEEKEAFRTEAQAYYDSYVNQYAAYYLTEDTDEARAAAKESAEAMLAAYGLTVDVVIENLETNSANQKLLDSLLADKDLTVTEEEIADMYAQLAAQYQAAYENNLPAYDYNHIYQGEESLYTPAGYRAVTHILLMVDADLLSAYTDAQAAYEEAGEGADDSAVKAAREAILKSQEEKINAIIERLANGESFDALIAEYGEDPGMKNEETRKAGYAVHPDSIIWDAAFLAGAFSEKMQKPGDVSDPVIGEKGIHILYYLSDIPAGIAEMTTEYHDDIRDYLTSSKKNDIFLAALEGWKADYQIAYHQDALAKLTAE